MIIEWECILECNYRCFYCSNGRNDMLNVPINYEMDKIKVFDFLYKLKEMYPDDELFLFGGEPFIHPFIDEIIYYMNSINLKYIIQTNFSLIDKIKEIAKNNELKIQISLHFNEISDKIKLFKYIHELQHIIRRIDIMYIGKESLNLYKEVLPLLNDTKILYIAPVADFNMDNVCNDHLFEFNTLKRGIYGKIYRFEKGNRSFKWEDQMKGNISYKGQLCLYRHNYILFDPSLRSYTCNYRQNNDICPNNQCFLM